MSIGKLRGHLFTIKNQAEGALAAGKEVDIEMGAIKRENSTNKYLLQRIENIVFGKHNPKGDTEELIDRIKSAIEQDETLKEVQRLRSLEFSLRNELNKVEKDLSFWRQGYDQLYSLFGRLQDLVLGKDSVTEAYEDLYKPIEQLVKVAELSKKAAGLIAEAPPKTLIGHLEAIEAKHKFSSKQFGRTYTPPEGHILVEQKHYDELVKDQYHGENKVVHRDFYAKLVKDSETLASIRAKLSCQGWRHPIF